MTKEITVDTRTVLTPIDYRLAVTQPPQMPGVVIQFRFDDAPEMTIAICPEMAEDMMKSLPKAVRAATDRPSRN